jgi:hypothetical protein
MQQSNILFMSDVKRCPSILAHSNVMEYASAQFGGWRLAYAAARRTQCQVAEALRTTHAVHAAAGAAEYCYIHRVNAADCGNSALEVAPLESQWLSGITTAGSTIRWTW